MCKHDEGMDISPGLTVTCFCWSYYCPGEDNHNGFFILFNEAEYGLATVPSNAHLQSVCAAVRNVCGNFMTSLY